MKNGTLTKYDPERFFGFIAPDDGGRNVFVHGSALRKAGIDDPRVGDRYSFALEQYDGRDCAGALYRTEAAQ